MKITSNSAWDAMVSALDAEDEIAEPYLCACGRRCDGSLTWANGIECCEICSDDQWNRECAAEAREDD